MAKTSYADLELAFSVERVARYLAWAGGDPDRAVELYTLNTQISEALYLPLQALELALRNRIHGVLAEAFQERWFHHRRFFARRQAGRATREGNQRPRTQW